MVMKSKTPCNPLPAGIAKVMKRLHYPLDTDSKPGDRVGIRINGNLRVFHALAIAP
ncbi:hypothetical protein GNZ12_08150 [Paraburkholderia sp. 1N]|uniref:Uncharacterized protein n=2 Tax=Paraburkholderia solitsugae TaxID=2675748 RepID=A0ABX2BK38_9BURK|nr:hypothetical protein [Paraburkholderia solitsugae]